MRLWLNWIEHLTSDQRVGGSSPSERAKTFMFMMSNSKSVITSSFFGTICSLLVCFSLLSCGSSNTVLIDDFEIPLIEEERSEESFKENRSESSELLDRNYEEDLTLLTPQSPLAAGHNEFFIEQSVEGLLVSRLTIVSVPEVLDPNHTYPVIFGFHGNGGTPQSMIPLLDRFVRDGRIIAVYPEGYMRSWNLGPELSPCLLYTSPSPRDRG